MGATAYYALGSGGRRIGSVRSTCTAKQVQCGLRETDCLRKVCVCVLG